MKYNDNCNVNTAMPIVQQEYSSTHWKTLLGVFGTDRCAKRRGRSEGGGEWLAIEIQTPELCIIMPVRLVR